MPIGPPFQQSAPAAAPSYLAARGVPRYPTDLLNHDCIPLSLSSAALIEWKFERADKTITINPSGRLIVRVDGASAAIDFARSGQGIVGTFENWETTYMKIGDLQPVLPEWWAKFEWPQLYISSRFTSAH